MKKWIQQRASDDRVFLGVIRKVDEGIEDDAIGGPSDVEKLWRPKLPSTIWEVLETYVDVFCYDSVHRRLYPNANVLQAPYPMHREAYSQYRISETTVSNY